MKIKYSGKYGKFEANFEKKRIVDELDRAKIWEDSGHDHESQRSIYAGILDFSEYFGCDPDDFEFDVTDFGQVATIDKITLWLGPEGSGWEK